VVSRIRSSRQAICSASHIIASLTAGAAMRRLPAIVPVIGIGCHETYRFIAPTQ
jgi:hypothetical protein